MDAVLRQSKAVCPFLKKTCPATLRSLSTTTPARQASPGGGRMSNLQTMARRCPVMGKALAMQTAKNSKLGGLGGVAALGAIRAFTGKAGSGKAKLHTTSSKEARPIEGAVFGRDSGMLFCCKIFIYPANPQKSHIPNMANPPAKSPTTKMP